MPWRDVDWGLMPLLSQGNKHVDAMRACVDVIEALAVPQLRPMRCAMKGPPLVGDYI